MLETAVLLDNPGGGAVAEPKNDGGGSGGGGGEEEGGNQNSGGNRWPHEETLTLLKIRSEMDLTFRDSTLKGPLWDEVSRKMEEFGYQRSAKKCREKFENIYKYHRRTKEGRSGRQTGKNYRFFEQLELFDAMQGGGNKIAGDDAAAEAELASPTPVAMIKPNTNIVQDFRIGFGGADVLSASTSTTYSSGKDSGGSSARRRRERKLAGYFEKLMKEVLEKQENLQKKFLEAIERCESQRMAREEAWKKQEIERLKREQQSLAQERAVAEAKDAAVIAFLQKIAKHPILVHVEQQQQPQNLVHSEQQPQKPQSEVLEPQNNNNNNGSAGETTPSSSRWPKSEVEALIRIRTNLDLQNHDSGSSKGPLWEDISAEMKKIGYDRNAKRCKEKWENINKYYRRVKDSNKRRPEDSKTCPYFHILDSLYQTKSRKLELSPTPDLPNFNLKAGEMLLQIMTQNQPGKEDGERSNNAHQSQEHDEDEDVDEDNSESEDGFQIVANQP